MHQTSKNRHLSYLSRKKRENFRKYKKDIKSKEIIKNFKRNKLNLFLSQLTPVNDYDIYDEVA